MKKLVLSFAVVTLLFCAPAAYAAEGKKPLSSQQNRMKTCAAQYRQKKMAKSEYRNFMKQCLRTHPANAKADTGKK